MSTPRRALARPLTLALIAAFAIAMLPAGAARPVRAFSEDPATVWINELHYDNTGTDTGEAIEIAGPAGTNLTGWSLVLYNGSTGAVYDTDALSGTLADLGAGYGVASISYPANGLQNGSPDGIALVNGTTLVQFLSYEGSFAAVGGAADGLVSTDIGVAQPGTGAVGQSLQLTGTGTTYQDFTWGAESTSSFGALNPGQTIGTAVDAAPSVSTTTPANGGTNVAVDANVSITFSEAVDLTDPWFTISCTSSGAHAATANGGPTTFTLDPATDFANGETCTVTVTATAVSDDDAIDPPDLMAADHAFAFTTVAADPCATTDTPIGAVQGSGASAAITGTVTVQGVVVGDYEGPTPALRGFYLQDAGDGDATTSDGIFVFNNIGGTSPNLVSLGQAVQVTGNAGENQGQTQVSASAVVDCGTTGTVTPTDIGFPVADATGLEDYEGMLVRVPETMTVTEHFQLGRFGQVVISSGGRLQNPTAVVAPGAPAAALQAANDLRKVIVDDASQVQNPDPILFGRGGSPLSASNTLRGGDTITNLTGVMTYTWAGNAASGNAYRIRPINAMSGTAAFVAVNARPGALEVDGDTRVAAMNLLNYFNTFDGLPDSVNNCTQGVGGVAADCRGADTQAEFDRQIPKTVAAIIGLEADVIGVNEIENDGYGASSAIAHLVAQLNLVAGAGTYAYIDADAATGQVNALGDDAIKVGLIYRPAAVTPVGDTAVLNTPEFVLGGDAPPAPPAPQLRSRPSLAQAFETVEGARFIVDVNHLKSKGSACDAPDAGDGQGNCNTVRTNAATELAAWLASDPTGTGDDDVLIIGDLNSYAMEDPVTVLTNAGYTNLVSSFIGADAYSYVFDGQWGYLDHALGSPSAVDQVAAVVEWHINADEPSVLDYNTDFKSAGQIASLYAPDTFRVSDHDPIIVGLDAAGDAPTVDAGGPYLVEELGTVGLSATGGDPTGDAVTYAWDLDGNGSFETAGQDVTFSAGTLQAPQTVTVTVRITDENGQSSTDTATIDVIWDFRGFGPPAAGGSATMKAGAALPVKFSLAGDQGIGVLDGSPMVQRWACATGTPIGAPFAAAVNEPFAYDPSTDEYKFVWKTQKGWADTCATLTVALDDGQAYELDVRFTK